jgi:predicted SPOUT superfamily RNA methylase MTH1
MPQPVEIEEDIPPKTRITLRFPDDESQYPEPVHPDIPRTEGGYYWGYQVRKCNSLSNVFTESPYEGGYDVSIGTSERGTTIPTAFPPGKRVNFKHMLVVFGGPRGLEFAAMNDEELSGMEIQGAKTKELFDHWVNVLPNQGSRTIRTDEAVFIALTALRSVWER